MDGVAKSAGTVSFTGDAVKVLRMTMMLRCLLLEGRGIKAVKHSVLAQVKRELGFKGSRDSVEEQLAAHLNKVLDASGATAEDRATFVAASRPQ